MRLEFPEFMTRDFSTRHIHVADGDVNLVLVGAKMLSQLYLTLIKTVGYTETAKMFYDCQKELAYRLQKSLMKDYDINEVSDEELVNRITRLPFYGSSYGYGIGETKALIAEKGEFIFRMSDSFMVEELLKNGMDQNVCQFIAGNFAGLAWAWSEQDYDCEEISCVANGAPYCEFRLYRKD